jgi:predicted RNase H-like nuclease (RuvC/YqgF family)
MAKKKRETKTTATAEPPSIVRLAAQISNTEDAIGTECSRNVQIQMKLNESTDQLSNLRKVLAGLHREMDKFTASTESEECSRKTSRHSSLI